MVRGFYPCVLLSLPFGICIDLPTNPLSRNGDTMKKKSSSAPQEEAIVDQFLDNDVIFEVNIYCLDCQFHDPSIYMYIYTYIHISTYIHIYIYIRSPN